MRQVIVPLMGIAVILNAVGCRTSTTPTEGDTPQRWEVVEKGATAPEQYDRKFALIVGINKYSYLGDVNYAVNDAILLQEILDEEFGFTSVNSLVLTDEDATREGLTKAISEWLRSQNPGDKDCVLFFFSGHGLIHDRQGYLAAADSGDVSTWIPVSWIVKQLDDYPAHKATILDCCYSGSLFRTGGETRDDSRRVTKPAFVGLSAGRDAPVRVGIDYWQHSAFTCALDATLRTRAYSTRKDQMFTFPELAVHVEQHMEQIQGVDQRPDWGTVSEGSRDFFFFPVRLGSVRDLIDLLQTSVATFEWDDVGGPSHIEEANGSLTITATAIAHREVHAFLSQLRNARELPLVPPPEPPPESNEVQRLHAILDEVVEFDYLNRTLKDVTDDISLRHNIPIVIDNFALEEIAIGTDSPVNIVLQNTSLHSALKVMLNEFGLVFEVTRYGIEVTTPEQVESALHVRVYHALDLIESLGSAGYAVESLKAGNELIELIELNVAPVEWDTVGGESYIEETSGSLTIVTTADTHREVHTFLSQFRVARELPLVPPPEPLFPESNEVHRIRAILDEMTEFDYLDNSLRDVVDDIALRHNISIVLDIGALRDFAIDRSTPVTAVFRDISLRSALGLMLKQLELVFVIDPRGSIIITTLEAKEINLETRVYDARDLIDSLKADYKNNMSAKAG